MAHKISIQEAKEKFEWEQHCRELNESGIPVNKVPRWKRKQQKRQTKRAIFMGMLFDRGGHIEQKNPKKKKGEQDVQQETEQSHT